VPNAIYLNFVGIAESLYFEAKAKTKGYWLLYLRTKMAEAYREIGLQNKSKAMLNEALNQDSTSGVVWEAFGDYYMQLGIYDSSIMCYKRAIQTQNGGYSNIEITLKIADYYLKNGRNKEAKLLLQEFLKNNTSPRIDYRQKVRDWCAEQEKTDFFDSLSP
jgi:tetratricopeptide (TPR) repeat protein